MQCTPCNHKATSTCIHVQVQTSLLCSLLSLSSKRTIIPFYSAALSPAPTQHVFRGALPLSDNMCWKITDLFTYSKRAGWLPPVLPAVVTAVTAVLHVAIWSAPQWQYKQASPGSVTTVRLAFASTGWNPTPWLADETATDNGGTEV